MFLNKYDLTLFHHLEGILEASKRGENLNQ